MVDNFYPYPEKYKFELDFYDIDYNDVKFYNNVQDWISYQRNKCKEAGCYELSNMNSKYCDNHKYRCEYGDCGASTTKVFGKKYCEKHKNISKICIIKGCNNPKQTHANLCIVCYPYE